MTSRRTVLTAVGSAVALGALSQRAAGDAQKEPIAILGTGRFGQVLGKRWAAAGHRIVFGSRTPQDARVANLVKEIGARALATTLKDAVAQANLVVFALPWAPVKDLLPSMGDLSGKLIVDPMNEIRMVAGYPEPPPDVSISVAEQLQAWVPGAQVVKAFNTPGGRTVLDPRRALGPMTIPLAGADAAAKARVATLVSELDLEPLDVGPLVAARYLEGMMRLGVGHLLYNKGKQSFVFHLRVIDM